MRLGVSPFHPNKDLVSERIAVKKLLLERQHNFLVAGHVDQLITALLLFWHGEIQVACNGLPRAGFRKRFLREFRFNRAAIAFCASAFWKPGTSAAANWDANSHAGTLNDSAGSRALRAILLRRSFIADI